MRRPTKAQVNALAWAIYRGNGMLLAMDYSWLEIRDATVAALETAGWIDRVKWFDAARKWRWTYFYVTSEARALPSVRAEVDRLRSAELRRDDRATASDDAEVPS